MEGMITAKTAKKISDKNKNVINDSVLTLIKDSIKHTCTKGKTTVVFAAGSGDSSDITEEHIQYLNKLGYITSIEVICRPVKQLIIKWKD